MVRPSDFRLTFARDDFFWAEERRPGLPILRWLNGAICEPVVTFFGYSTEIGRAAVSSLKTEAYALREWLAFLANQGVEWHEVDDLLIHRWRQSFEARLKAKSLKKARVERKI